MVRHKKITRTYMFLLNSYKRANFYKHNNYLTFIVKEFFDTIKTMTTQPFIQFIFE